jgi:hypothetical protein
MHPKALLKDIKYARLRLKNIQMFRNQKIELIMTLKFLLSKYTYNSYKALYFEQNNIRTRTRMDHYGHNKLFLAITFQVNIESAVRSPALSKCKTKGQKYHILQKTARPSMVKHFCASGALH